MLLGTSLAAVSGALPPRPAPAYERRRPEDMVLYGTLQAHWRTFLADLEDKVDAGGRGPLPRFVVAEVEAYLRCGILGYGFVRARCRQCGHNRAVAFSCKRRGFCPSCVGRRMSDVAAALVDRVLPDVPVRQWVLSAPHPLRLRMAYDPSLVSELFAALVAAIAAWQRRCAHKLRIEGVLKSGGVTAVQRFGSALELNVHLHNLSFDGVYSFTPGRKPEFHPLPAPTDEEVADVAAAVVRKMTRRLARRGLGADGRPLDPDAGPDEDETLTRDGQALLAISSASVQGLVAVGPRAGQRPGRIRGAEASNDNGALGPRCAQVDGYNLHANVQVRAGDRKRLERLCRYLGRPPLANDRLKETHNGRLLIEFKRPWRDGTTHIELTPEALIARLCALVPRPHKHLMRYHGVLAPAFAQRREIVRAPTASVEEAAAVVDAATTRKTPFPVRHPWAELLKRVFLIDVLQCPKCPGRMDIVGAVLERSAVEKVLGAMGLSADVPELHPARPPPQEELPYGGDDGPPNDGEAA